MEFTSSSDDENDSITTLNSKPVSKNLKQKVLIQEIDSKDFKNEEKKEPKSKSQKKFQ